MLTPEEFETRVGISESQAFTRLVALEHLMIGIELQLEEQPNAFFRKRLNELSTEYRELSALWKTVRI